MARFRIWLGAKRGEITTTIVGLFLHSVAVIQGGTDMKLHSIVLALALVVPSLAGADDKSQQQPKTGDTTDPNKKTTKKLAEAEIKIVAHLHHVNQMEIEMGKLAQRMGTQTVKKYGQMMVTDHQTADTELIKFARDRGVPKIPPEKPETEAEKMEMKTQMDGMAAIKKLKGADFDREYLRMMVESHEKELAKTDAFVATSMDSDLDNMLNTRKTTLQRHADAAKELQRGNSQAAK
jgi:putative membrane protein